MKRKLPKTGLVLLTLGIAGCGAPVADTTGANSASSLSTGNYNTKPQVLCAVRDANTHQLLSQYGTQMNTTQFNVYAQAGQSLVLDCSGTTDNLYSSSQLSISANFGTGSQTSAAQVFTTSYAMPGIYPVQVTAANPDGLPQVLNFNLVVTCADGQYPLLVVDASKITVTQQGDPNQFTYSANGAASGGSGQYQYSWDFNGAGSFDLYENNPTAPWVNPVLWNTASTANEVYTAFAGTRNVQLAVRDTVCQNTAQGVAARNFNITRVPAGTALPVPVIKPNYFLQADVAQLNTASPLLNSNGEFIAQLTPAMAGVNRKKHVQCGYAKARLADQAAMSIYGIDFFDKDSNGLAEHGISLKINNIADTGATGTQDFNSASGASLVLQNAEYITAESADDQQRLIYNQVGNCQVEIMVKRLQAVVPCISDPTMVANDVVQIDGKYSCPNLQTSASQGSLQVELDNGYFYCEVSYTNQCAGGGGGGGGQPPIPY